MIVQRISVQILLSFSWSNVCMIQNSCRIELVDVGVSTPLPHLAGQNKKNEFFEEICGSSDR